MTKQNKLLQTVYDNYTRIGVCTDSLSRSAPPRDVVAKLRFRDWLPTDPHAPILDLGCGSGDLLLQLASMGHTDVTGVDGSQAQVQLAASKGVNVQHADALTYLCSLQRPLKCVLLIDVLEHFSLEEGFDLLQAVKRALASDGSVVLQVPNAGSPLGSRVQYGDLTHQAFYSVERIRMLARVVGFDKVDIRECGPVPYGIVSSIRYALWKACRTCLRLYDLIETGAASDAAYTRVVLARLRL